MKISVVIPALNESSGITRVVIDCMKFAHEVIVVDGGSFDDTVEQAKVAGARVIHQPLRGYGLAIITGMQAATGDVIATADGDGTYPVQSIPLLASQLNADTVFISGSRFPLLSRTMSGEKCMSRRNQIGNTALTALASTLWMHKFSDILSGMWVFKRGCLSSMSLYSGGWDLSQEIKLEALKQFGSGFKEVHIDYYERSGLSKLLPWKVGFENLRYFFVHRLGLRGILSRSFTFPMRDNWDHHWDRFGEASDTSPATLWRNSVVERALGIKSDDAKLVEFGCGRGVFAKHITSAHPQIHYVGVDMSAAAIRACQAMKIPRSKFVCGGPARFKYSPIGGTRFTHAVCSEVIEHVSDDQMFMDKCYEALPMGCRFVVTTQAGPMNEFYKTIGHRRHYDEYDLARIMARSGFNVIRMHGAGFPFFNIYRLMLTIMGSSVAKKAGGKPSLLDRIALSAFRFLFKFNSKWHGWQTVVVGLKA